MGANDFGTRRPAPGARAQRRRVLQRDPICRCAGCKSCTEDGCTRSSTEDDHIIPISRGGNTSTSTVADQWHQGMCNPCHKVKSNKEALAARWKIREERAPEPHPGLR